MDLLKEIQKIKDEDLRKEAEKKIVETLQADDEMFFFEEETRDMAGWRYIEQRLIEKDNSYYTKAVPQEGPFCKRCWKEEHQLNLARKTNTNGVYNCMICDMKDKH